MSADAPPREQLGSPSGSSSRRHVLLSPGAIGVHVFAVVVTAVCALAGGWQLETYRSEQAAASADRSSEAPVPVTELMDVNEGLRSAAVGRRVVARGTYAPADEQLLVAGRELGGRSGWWVLSPLLVSEQSALLVVRGWTDEEVLPPVPTGPVSVTASIQPGEEAPAGARVSPTGDARVVDAVRLPSLVNELPYRLYPAYGMRTEEQPSGADTLAPVEAPKPEPSWRTGGRSLAYALQWWAFGAFALFMWWRIMADRLHAAPVPRAPGRAP